MNDASSPETGPRPNPAATQPAAEHGSPTPIPDAAHPGGQATADTQPGQESGQTGHQHGEQHTEEQQEEPIEFDKFVAERFPEVPPEVRATGKEIYETLHGPGVERNERDQITITDPKVKEDIIKKAKSNNLTKEQLRLFLQVSGFVDPDEVNQIIDEAELPELQRHVDEDSPDAVEPHIQHTAESQAEGHLDEASDKLQELLDAPDSRLNEEEKIAIKEKQGVLNGMKNSVKDLFADGEPGQRYSRLAMQIIMWTILIAVGAVILDAVAINHAAGKRQR